MDDFVSLLGIAAAFGLVLGSHVRHITLDKALDEPVCISESLLQHDIPETFYHFTDLTGPSIWLSVESCSADRLFLRICDHTRCN